MGGLVLDWSNVILLNRHCYKHNKNPAQWWRGVSEEKKMQSLSFVAPAANPPHEHSDPKVVIPHQPI